MGILGSCGSSYGHLAAELGNTHRQPGQKGQRESTSANGNFGLTGPGGAGGEIKRHLRG